MQISTITLVNDYRGAIRGDSTVGYFSNVDGPMDVSLYICADSTDSHMSRAAERFEVPMEALIAFRDSSVHGESRALPV
ncbi:hypothetical protein WKW77_12130 [Variovorax ureilyticus]|uniref:Uncharacterized protein n=1 Tax=Variovorax ureilyticus TaxID=1836198 RepID=A0ABU8VFW0_9BURK